jgi:hypothetical protein
MDAKKKRLNRTTVRTLAWGAGAAAFALPWAAFQLVPSVAGTQASQQQVITVPAGSQVVVTKGPNGVTGVKVVGAKAGTAAPVTTTGASAPPPKI